MSRAQLLRALIALTVVAVCLGVQLHALRQVHTAARDAAPSTPAAEPMPTISNRTVELLPDGCELIHFQAETGQAFIAGTGYEVDGSILGYAVTDDTTSAYSTRECAR